MDLASRIAELLWIGSLAAIPLALLVAAACRWPRCRPATRHAMWAAVLVSFVAPALGTLFWRPAWFQSQRVLAAAQPLLASDTAPVSVPPPRTERQASARTAPQRLAYEPPLWTVAPPVVRESSRLPEVVRSPAATERASIQPTEQRQFSGQPAVAANPGTRDAARDDSSNAAQTKPAGHVPSKAQLPVSVPAPAVANEKPASPRPAARPDAWRAEVGDWLAHMLVVRDEIARIPPFPAALWIGGAAIMIACFVVRAVFVRRVLLRARPATGSTLRLVGASAQRMGLSRAPQTLFVDDRVSPMILCGVRPRLILPSQLWLTLDDASRFAVVTHELAHLRRRDHQWSWLVALVGIAYWWHPVAWWARWRLRDEADACCDAWVTSLLPASRRAYAEALVVTKSFLSTPGRCAPLGLGVMSGRARCLARRIKMVMTQRVAPKTSPLGAIAALSIAVAGMFVMPALACPPESKNKQHSHSESKQKETKHKEQKHKEKAAAEHNKAHAPKAKHDKDSPQVQFLGEAPALEAMRGSGATPAAPAASSDRDRQLRELEERLMRLEQRILEYQNRQRGPRSMSLPTPPAPGTAATPAAAPQPLAAPAAPAPTAGTPQPAPPPATTTPSASVDVSPAFALPPGSILPGIAYSIEPWAVINVVDQGPQVDRAYYLPSEKLKPLTALMARDDVPILIMPFDDRIVVRATEAQQRVFGNFVLLIHPESYSNGSETGASELLAVPVLPRTSARSGDTEQAIRQLRDRLKQLERQYRDVEREAGRCAEKACGLQEKEHSLRDQADSIRERAMAARDESKRQKLMAEADRVCAKADAAAAEAAELEAKSADAAGITETLGAEIEELEALIEEAMHSSQEEDDSDPNSDCNEDDHDDEDEDDEDDGARN